MRPPLFFKVKIMQIDFYKNLVPKNRLYRKLTGHLVAQGHLKEATDILNPVITVAYNAYHININYCYIPDFGRYYFINDYIIDGDTVTLKLHVDVLYTYRNNILNSQCIAERSSSSFSIGLTDGFIKAENGYRYNFSKFPYTFGGANSCYILTVTGGDNT